MNDNLSKTIRQLLIMAIIMIGYLIFMLAIAVYTRPAAAASPAPVLTSYATNVNVVDANATNVNAVDANATNVNVVGDADGVNTNASSANELSDTANDISAKASSVAISMCSPVDDAELLAEYLYEEAHRPRTPVEVYCAYADEIVETYYPNLDPAYIKAIIYRESRFEPTEVNKKTNVIGLMQIMPKWHMERARSLGVDDLTDPYGNILVGCDLLSEMTEKYSMTYAINYFAGGYKYADRYRNSQTSPVIDELNSILKHGRIETLKEQQEAAGLYVV